MTPPTKANTYTLQPRGEYKMVLSASLYISTNNKVITLWPLYTYKNCYSNNRMHHLALHIFYLLYLLLERSRSHLLSIYLLCHFIIYLLTKVVTRYTICMYTTLYKTQEILLVLFCNSV